MNTDSVHIPNVTPKVSVVIPVWNPGKGISRCVDSLCGQTLENIEMVFVDDCGTDGAMDIIRAAAAKDPRIRIMTNAENIGPGASRDKAIELAQGEYISFVDADDYIDPDFLEILYWKGKADDLDIIKGTYMREKEDGTVCSQSFKTNDVIREGLGKNKPLFFLFNAEYQSALFHSRLFANPDVRFGLTCNGEDTLFLLKACHVAMSFGIDDRAVYHYLYRNASATNTMTEKSFKDRILALQCIVEYLVSHIEPNPYAVLYFTPKLKYYLSLQRYASQMARMDEISSLFLAGLQELALNYPAIETCKNEDFVIFALMEYGENLVSWFYQSSWKVVPPEDYTDVVVRSVDFLQSHPEYYKELPTLISKANGFAKRMESDGISKEKIEAYEKQIRALWRKPLIMWMLFKNKLRRVLVKLKRKFFTKKQIDL